MKTQTFTGTVLDEAGDGWADALVELQFDDGTGELSGPTVTGVTDSGGDFSIDAFSNAEDAQILLIRLPNGNLFSAEIDPDDDTIALGELESSGGTDTVKLSVIPSAGGGSSLAKATGAEVDTGTDDAKYVTAKAIEDSSYAKTAAITAAVAAAISDTAYAGSWNAVTDVAPSKNAVYDKIEAVIASIPAAGPTNSAGNNVVAKSNGTNFVASKITDDGTDVTVSPIAAGTFILQQAATPTDDIFRVLSSAAATLFSIDSSGNIALVDGKSILRAGTASTMLTYNNGGGHMDIGITAVQNRVAGEPLYLGDGLKTKITGSTGAVTMTEQTAPSAPGANEGTLFLVDNGSGKTVLKVQFATGAAQVVATEP